MKTWFILLLTVILGPLFSPARVLKSVNVSCFTRDKKAKVTLNLSKSEANLFLNSKTVGSSLILTFPVCQDESSLFRFSHSKESGYSFIFDSRRKSGRLFKGENLKCDSKPLASLQCK